MKVQPEMLLKTKEGVRSPRSEVQSRETSAAGVPVLTPGSLLLAPVLQEMKVHPEILLKTHDREHGTRGAHAPVTGYPGNMLKTKVRLNPITHHKSPFANPLTPDSLLLTPALKK